MSNTLFETHPIEPILGPRTILFTVFGTPVPQGSTRAFIPKGWKRAIITTDNAQLKPWRQQVSGAALALNVPPFDKETPIAIVLDFYFAKPASVSKKRIRPTVKPDLDKICRSLFDALTGILFADDSQIVDVHARKHYGSVERVEVQIAEAT